MEDRSMLTTGRQLGLGALLTCAILVGAGCNPTPIVENMTPTQGTEDGGTSIQITGQKFKVGATVQFGGQSLTPTNVTKTSMSIVSPAGAVGSVQVTVENPKQKRAEKQMSFTYLDTTAPTVSSVSPSDGHVYAQGAGYEDAIATGLTQITAKFSEPLASATVAVSSASLPDAITGGYSGSVNGATTVSGDTVTFTASEVFASARSYTVSVEGVDVAGNRSAAKTTSFSVGTPKRLHRYVVQEGDTLQSIAARPDTYEDAEAWKKILLVNQDYNEINRDAPQAGLGLWLHWDE
ncbi:hypothetical protein CMK11_13440 [Candidatus Poribacteria bacterium]|nr:hypothetical protein [Candidatus Poribacteria bacterium]